MSVTLALNSRDSGRRNSSERPFVKRQLPYFGERDRLVKYLRHSACGKLRYVFEMDSMAVFRGAHCAGAMVFSIRSAFCPSSACLPSRRKSPNQSSFCGPDVLFHARGLINTKAIQNNLDWVWPYWVERQFNPADVSFIPRAFSFSHINLTHRNWTAVGLPDVPYYPIVDPRGLVTPHFDGWSLDFWLIGPRRRRLAAHPNWKISSN